MSHVRTITLDALATALRRIGQPFKVMPLPGGASALILQHGARLLGIFPSAGGENCLWTNPALADVESGKALCEGEAWHNTGGERTWLAPEVEFFYPNWPDRNPHRTPVDLDPGQYAWTGGGLALSNAMTLRAHRSGGSLSVRITRTFSADPSPLTGDMDDVEYAGVAVRASVELLEPANRGTPPFGLWSLLQLPDGGEALAPTYGVAVHRLYFGEIPATKMQSTEDGLRWRMGGPGVQKIGLDAAASTGRLGYVYGSRDRWTLVVKDFMEIPTGKYVDAPGDEIGVRGDAAQICNVNLASLGAFCELEHHAPAVGDSLSCSLSEDVSRVWAFHGSFDGVRRIAVGLLGMIPDMSSSDSSA